MKKLEDMTEPELRELMNAMGKGIEFIAETLGAERPHFCLVLYNDPKIAQYVGNCERASMIEAMRETADRLESRQAVERSP